MNNAQALEELEIDLLLEGVYQHLGYDLRGYERANVRHKLFTRMDAEAVETLSSLQDRVLHDRSAGQALLNAFGNQGTALFAEPAHVRLVRDHLAIHLKSYPAPKIWLAECNSVQTAWTMAILLDESRVYDKTLIFATGSSAEISHRGWQAEVPADRRAQYEENYRLSGGTASLATYFDTEADLLTLRPHWRKNIVWAQHNLVTDASFNEFQFIMCRGVLADFGPLLRSKVLRLFHDSLSSFGLLSLDHVTPLEAQYLQAAYQPLCTAHGLFKRTN